MNTTTSDADAGLPPGWAIEPPLRLPSGMPPQQALLLGRYALLNVGTLTSAILLVHVCAAAWLEARCLRAVASGNANTTADTGGGASADGPPPASTPTQAAFNVPPAPAPSTNANDAERRSVPRSEALRGALFLAFALGVSGAVFLLRIAMSRMGVGVWRRECSI